MKRFKTWLKTRGDEEVKNDQGDASVVSPASLGHTRRMSASSQANAPHHQRRTSEELLDGLGKDIFKKDFDAVQRMLDSLPDEVEEKDLDEEMSDKDVAKDVISNRLLKQIMSNYTSFVQGMQHVRDIELELTNIRILCKNARRLLARADEDLVVSSMQVLSKLRRKERLTATHGMLARVSKLFEEEREWKELLAQGRIADGVKLFNTCLRGLKELEQLQCLSDMYQRLSHGKQVLRSKVASVFLDSSLHFSEEALKDAILACFELVEVDTIGQNLVECYVSSMERTVRVTIAKFITKSSGSINRMSFSDLCGLVRRDGFNDCLYAVLQVVSDTLHNYLLAEETVETVIQSQLPAVEKASKHRKTTSDLPEDVSLKLRASLSTDSMDASTARFVTAEECQQAVAEVKGNRKEIWKSGQDLVRGLLDAIHITESAMPLADFMELLTQCSKLVVIGEYYTAAVGHGHQAALILRQMISSKCRQYVDGFHKQSLDSMKLTVENDMWRALPLPKTFSCADIKELRQAQAIMRQAVQSVSSPTSGGGAPELLSPASSTSSLSGSNNAELCLFEEPASIWDHFQKQTISFTPMSRDMVELDDDAKDEPSASPPPLMVSASAADADDSKMGSGRGLSVPPIVTSTSLKFARSVGKYVAVMQALPPFALYTLRALCELFDFYLYTAFTTFGVSIGRFFQDSFDDALYPHLRGAVIAIRHYAEVGLFGLPPVAAQSSDAAGGHPQHAQGRRGSAVAMAKKKPSYLLVRGKGGAPSGSAALGAHGSVGAGTSPLSEVLALIEAHVAAHAEVEPAQPSAGDKLRNSFHFGRNKQTDAATTGCLTARFTNGAPTLSRLHSEVSLHTADTLYGVVERMTAAESFLFIVEVFRQMEHRIALCLPKECHYHAAQFIEYIQQVSQQFMTYMHRNLATQVVRADTLIQEILSCRWDVKSISSKHNQYVSSLLQKIKSSRDTLTRLGGLSKSAQQQLWRECIEFVMERLLEGYSRIKKCTTEGRALMSLDLNELKTGLETLLALRPVPLWSHVITWVKAYYLPSEDDFLKWVADHPEYKLPQVLAVAQTGLGTSSHMKKKQRQQFISRVQATYNKIHAKQS